ncbi:phosphotransferase family protein [Amycolatopsis rhizosphaerae]|uniref:phosphotransferase family protein n=1 Tax=Amycolatopsis rhizosphaerae TaxID=2053003 RepID=UPI001FEC01CB|nr:phosphotransferase family protein [Amycolatopsis rhizosphaerae]
MDIHGLRRLSGGASRETWEFRARTADGAQRRLVLRRDPPGEGRPESMAREAAVLEAAREVPVPRLVDHGLDPSVLGSPYLLTEHVEGETLPRRLLRDEEFAEVRGTLAAELGRVLARIHRMPPVPGLPAEDPLERLVTAYDALNEPLPALEIALHWLRAHRPPPAGDTVVHGDFRNGNLMVRPDGLAAVLDWELVHRGDPMEDLGWLCVKAWRFGSALPVGGFGSREELFAGYAEVAGRAPDPESVHWWEVYGTATWAVLCRSQAERHLSGQTRSVELAAVGRRVCEPEHDLLLLLDAPAPRVPVDSPAAPASDLHGHPSAVELVTAVAEFLRTELLPATEGHLNFHTRVAANVLSIVERELTLGADQEHRHAERLATLGVANQAELAAALRHGRLDPDDPAVLAAVRAGVTDRLLVANPRYLSAPS